MIVSSTKCKSYPARQDTRQMLYVDEISSDHIIRRQMFVYVLRTDHEHYGLLLEAAHYTVFLIPHTVIFLFFIF